MPDLNIVSIKKSAILADPGPRPGKGHFPNLSPRPKADARRSDQAFTDPATPRFQSYSPSHSLSHPLRGFLTQQPQLVRSARFRKLRRACAAGGLRNNDSHAARRKGPGPSCTHAKSLRASILTSRRSIFGAQRTSSFRGARRSRAFLLCRA